MSSTTLRQKRGIWAYPTADGYIIAGALNDRLYAKMVTAMDLPELAEDTRFVTNHDRVANRVELTDILRARFLEEATDRWVGRFTSAGIPHSPLNSVEDVLNDPQTEARNMIADIEHPKIGPIRVPGIPIKFSETPGQVRLPPPGLGEHQTDVLDGLIRRHLPADTRYLPIDDD